MHPLIEFQDVTVYRGEKIALDGITLSIQAGEHVAILGPNGCGKSTLIKTLTCECYPVADAPSRLRIFGRERWEIFELRKRLGVVEPNLPGRSTLHAPGRDVVLSGFFASSAIWPEMRVTAAMRERADAALAQMEALHLADKEIAEMSAGEARRVLIARALVHAPRVLLLDEPSNALDLAAQDELRRILRALARQGTGILLVTHHLADVLPEIERVVLLREGRIVGDGPKEEMLTEQRLGELFGVRVSLARRDGFYHVW